MAKEITVLEKYLDFFNIFSKKLVIELPKYFDINKYAINLEFYKKLPYRPIYSLGLIELETLKTYIETNLINSFIHLSKFFAKAFIFFVEKLDSNFYLYINHYGFNNLTIKNQYLLLLIGKFFHQLDQTKQFF